MSRVLNRLGGPETTGTEEKTGFGCLRTEQGNLPLVALEARWHIHGLVARGTVRQRYRNPLEEALEATYIFPLPDRGAVVGFVMRVQDRTIEAELREREEARELYDQAIASGYRASIAEEERPEVFTLRVGNIPPNEDIDVELTVICPLDATVDQATFRFPLVVAPRYVSGLPLDGTSVGDGVVPDTDEVPDASRVTPPVLLDGFPNPVRLSLEVTIDDSELYSPRWIDGLASSLHSVLIEEGPPVRVRLQPGKRLDRDFILRIPLGHDGISSTFLVGRRTDAEEGVFSVTLVPPRSDGAKTPVDIVFVLDRSGSMSGWKMVTARRALQRMIDTLTDQDRFAVVAFDNVCEWDPDGNRTRRRLRDASSWNRWRTIRWLDNIDARGGTELGRALEKAVSVLAREGRRSPVLVIVTDGQVAGEDAVLRRLDRAAGGMRPRVLAVGIDEAVNAGLLRRLARWGNGVCELVESSDRLEDTMVAIQRCIRPPLVTNVTLQPKGWELSDKSIEPSTAVDLYPGRPATIMGRFRTTSPLEDLAVLATGTLADGQPWTCEVAARTAQADALLAIWGREKLRALEDTYVLTSRGRNRKKLEKKIVTVSLETRILCRFTALVAVDKSEVANERGTLIHVTQPVQLPHGWEVDHRVHGYPQCLGFLDFRSLGRLDVCDEEAMPAEDWLEVTVARPAACADPGEFEFCDAVDRVEELMELLEQLLTSVHEDVLPAEELAQFVALLAEELRLLADKLAHDLLRQRCLALSERGATVARQLREKKGGEEMSRWLQEVGEILRELSRPLSRRKFWTQ